LEEARQKAADAGIPAPLAELNIFRVLLHRPRLAKCVSDLLLCLLFDPVLDPRLRELVIMRIGWVTGSDYEWTQHWSIAQDRFGLTAEELLGVRDWRRFPLFGPTERAVLALTDDVLATGTASKATWEAAAAQLPGAGVALELVAAVATWIWVSHLTRALEIPLEEGVASWPPDGQPPPAAHSRR
jgi:alkylhydroperoxidase family enzyme